MNKLLLTVRWLDYKKNHLIEVLVILIITLAFIIGFGNLFFRGGITGLIIFLRGRDILTSLFLLATWLIAFLAFYYLLALLINQAILEITQQELLIKHRPIPWLGRTLRCNDIEQIYCTETIAYLEPRQRKGCRSQVKTFQVNTLLKNGRVVALFSGIENKPLIAFLIEETIKETLEIIK